MAMSRKNDKIFPPYQDDAEKGDTGEEGGASGSGGEGGQTGGTGGHIAFHEFIKTSEQRDDLLSGSEKARLLATHQSWHESLVKKQKDSIKRRQAVIEGELSVSEYRRGNADHPYREHPVLSQAAQFSGIDRQVTPLPNENEIDTNNDKKQELEYRYNLAYRPGMAMRFTPPKPSPM
jgi:hypothetical protein